MKQLAPGVYDDGKGGMHIDMRELLKANGYADTPDNRARLLAAWREFLHDHNTGHDPPIQLIEVD